MTIYVVIGKNRLTREVGLIGAATTLEKAEEIARENDYTIDDYDIQDCELVEVA